MHAPTLPINLYPNSHADSREESAVVYIYREPGVKDPGVLMEKLAENLKVARKNCIMGKYDTAKIYYQGCLNTAHRLSTSDKMREELKKKLNKVSGAM